MKPFSMRHPGLVVFLQAAGIVAVGLFIGILAAIWMNSMYRQSLLSRIHSAALAVDIAKIGELKGAESDVDLPAYIALKQRLLEMHKANPDAKFVYLMGQHDNDDIFFFSDSELPNSPDYSPPGQVFDEASESLRSSFKDRRDVIEGPVSDRWGVWLSVLTPIIDPATHKVVAVLGMDIPAQEYLTFMVAVALFPLAAALIAVVVLYSMRAQQRKRDEVISLKAELASIITHDLHSPLTGIRWAAERLAKTKQNTEQANLSLQIAQSVGQLEENVSEVFELARLGNQETALTLEPIEFTPLIQEVFAMQRLSAEQKSVELELADGWPQNLTIMCDRTRMKRVFNNLISNAVKYSNHDTVVKVSYTTTETGHRISVTDQGIGIPVADQEKVMSGFYRAGNARRSTVSGSGLGLYLASNTIKQHGGQLKIASQEGKGTTISIELPYHPL